MDVYFSMLEDQSDIKRKGKKNKKNNDLWVFYITFVYRF